MAGPIKRSFSAVEHEVDVVVQLRRRVRREHAQRARHAEMHEQGAALEVEQQVLRAPAHLAQAREVRLLRALEHVCLDGVEELRDGLGDVREWGGRFGAGVAPHGERLGLGEVLGADLEAEGDALCGDGVLVLGSVGV